ncbi:hypothetical protein, partial [Streptomyces fradiae]|uniref:hypothetical protein n=1 Tax=Streptomyces fradiae TaxID=1906 RepID=UPI0033F4C665
MRAGGWSGWSQACLQGVTDSAEQGDVGEVGRREEGTARGQVRCPGRRRGARGRNAIYYLDELHAGAVGDVLEDLAAELE